MVVDSNVRGNIKLQISTRHGDQYVDVITHEHTKPNTWNKEVDPQPGTVIVEKATSTARISPRS